MSETKYNIPQSKDEFKGEFIVFFSDEEKPKVLFHSIIADEAYRIAEEIFKKEGRRPTVILIQQKIDNIAHLLHFV